MISSNQERYPFQIIAGNQTVHDSMMPSTVTPGCVTYSLTIAHASFLQNEFIKFTEKYQICNSLQFHLRNLRNNEVVPRGNNKTKGSNLLQFLTGSQRADSGDHLLPGFFFDPGDAHTHPVGCLICQDLCAIGQISALVSADIVCVLFSERALWSGGLEAEIGIISQSLLYRIEYKNGRWVSKSWWMASVTRQSAVNSQ